jgi:hypothetical protein
VKEIDYLVWLDRITKPASEAPPIEPTLKIASESKIDQAIGAEYDRAEREREKPPNLKEIAKQVQVTLRSEGFRASQHQIQGLAEADKYKKRRRLPGRTMAADDRR